MFRTVFSRLVTVFIAVLLVVIAVQGTLLFRVYKNDAIVRMETSLMEEAHGIAELMTNYITYRQGENELYTYISVAVRKSRSEAWFVNSNGAVTLEADPGTPSIHLVTKTGTFSQKEMEEYLQPVLEGAEFSMVGNFLNRFDEETITVACPVFYGPTRIVGAVFMHCRVAQMQHAYNNGWKAIALVGIFAGTLAVLLMALLARSITRPLGEMNFAAHEFAKGHLDRRLKKTGPDELGQLAGSLNDMAAELGRQERMRIEFVANVSHEMKSPMTSIQGFAQGMLDGTIAEADREKYLGIIVDETRRMNKLVRDLLDLSQIESGKFTLARAEFDLHELLRRVIIRYADALEAKNIEPDIAMEGEHAYVDADPARMEQVLVNLIDNAMKYTPEGGSLAIATCTEGEKLRVSVNNSGTPIPQEDLQFIFDRFYKVDKSRADKKGTGLGLAIVKSILDQHGERITASSSAREGTTFCFTVQKAKKIPQRETSDEENI